MTLVRGGTVRPHVQAFADACSQATGAQSFGTYPGHSPSIDRALDIFVPVNSRVLGDAICQFAIANLKRFGVDYVIYRQRIYNPEISPTWRAMADRGNPTQNHFDHVHISFEPTAAAKPETEPEPVPEEQPPMEFTYIHAKEDWVCSTSARFHGRLPFGDLLEGLKKKGLLVSLGEQSREFHDGVVAMAIACGFSGDR